MRSGKGRLQAGAWAVGTGLALLALAAITGAPRWTPDARAEVREPPPPPQAFLSGGARSEIILREIADVLKRIDARLERLERAIDAANQQQPEPPPADGGEANRK